jgi:hypothetical protein
MNGKGDFHNSKKSILWLLCRGASIFWLPVCVIGHPTHIFTYDHYTQGHKRYQCIPRKIQDHGFKSKDEVIQHLLGLSADNVNAVPTGSDEDDGMDGVDDDVPKGKLAQGIFYASLGNDAKSVKHFTGLNDSAYQWVRQQLTQAVRKTLFFLFSLARATSCMANAVVLHL